MPDEPFRIPSDFIRQSRSGKAYWAPIRSAIAIRPPPERRAALQSALAAFACTAVDRSHPRAEAITELVGELTRTLEQLDVPIEILPRLKDLEKVALEGSLFQESDREWTDVMHAAIMLKAGDLEHAGCKAMSWLSSQDAASRASAQPTRGWVLLIQTTDGRRVVDAYDHREQAELARNIMTSTDPNSEAQRFVTEFMRISTEMAPFMLTMHWDITIASAIVIEAGDLERYLRGLDGND